MAIKDWPSEVTLRLSMKGGGPLVGAPVFVQIIAPKKNAYSLSPKLTTMTGAMRIPRQDHSATLDECHELAIVVDDRETSAERLASLRKYYPVEAAQLETLLSNATFPKRSLKAHVAVAPEVVVVFE